MKNLIVLIAIVRVGSLSIANAQNSFSDATAVGNSPKGAPYTLAERGLHHRLWQQITWTTNLAGVPIPRTNSFTEIATGLTHWNADHSALIDSSPQLVSTPNGAQSTNASHTVTFLGNINSSGAVTITLPDGQNLAMSPLCLSYFDSSSGKAVLLGQIKDSGGLLLPSGNEATYPDAYTDIEADLFYVNSIAGLEQLVILRQQPPDPTEWGLDPSTTYLQAITEVISGPTPQITPVLADDSGDNNLDFGSMQMVRGVGFAIDQETNTVPVSKHFAVLNGRTCLIEQIPFQDIQAQLHTLEPAPPSSGGLETNPNSKVHRLALRQVLPVPRTMRKNTSEMKMARSKPQKKGFALDFTMLTTQTNLLLQSDTTYYCSGTINVASNLIAEGGTVVKFTNSTAATIIASNVVQKTGPYRPVVFTSRDDNSVGEALPGSTGTPNGYYANVALNLSAAPAGLVLSNWHFCYLSNAVQGSSLVLRDVQFTRCKTALASGSTQPSFYNDLFYLINTVIANTSSTTVTAQNVTAHYCTNFVSNTSGSIRMTNCLFVCVTNWQCTTTASNYSTVVNSDSGVFQAAGGGAHYLAPFSTIRGTGTASVDAALLSELRQNTTYPPVLISNNVLSWTSDITLSPEVQRDTGASPDPGYHYPAMDFELCMTGLTNAWTMNISPGTVIGCFGKGANNYALGFGNGAVLNCQGTPNNLIRLVEYTTVQEQAGAGFTIPAFILSDFAQGPSTVNCRFTDFSSLAQDTVHVNGYTAVFNLRDSQMHGGLVNDSTSVVNLTNCLLERVSALLWTTTNTIPGIQNNLFYGGSFWFLPQATNPIVAYNLFDNTALTCGNNAGCNGFVNTTEATPHFTSDIIQSTSPSYQSGPLGNYYLPNTSVFINAGTNKTADALGLYHYTVSTNLVSGYEVKETNSWVDVTFHYVATDASGNPADSDSDGLPDYLEDSNGSGTYDATDLANWQNADSDGDGVNDYTEYIQGRSPRISGTVGDTNGVTQLSVFTPLK